VHRRFQLRAGHAGAVLSTSAVGWESEDVSPIIIALVLLNLGISYWNARVCGQVWNEVKALGGWMRLVVWSGAVQSAVGFSSVLMLLLGGLAYVAGHLPREYFAKLADLWYVLIIIPALMTGWVLTIHSWIVLARERSLMNLATTSWNTFASLKNTYDAVQGMGGALDSVGDVFSDLFDVDDAKAALALLVIGIAVSAVLGGVLLTWLIIKRHRGTMALPKLQRAAA
jgi:hypothetical protein